MLEEPLRQAATALLESAIRIAPPDIREWGEAMRGELHYVRGSWAALLWALGGASVLARGALTAFLIPGRRGQGLVPNGGLFARTISLRKAALAGGGACIVGALLFLLAPPFRQGIQVSLGIWRAAFHWNTPDGQPALTALARQAEADRDPEALAFCAVRLRGDRESARLAKEAVRLDPRILWVYAVVAVRHPELPEIQQWLPELERTDPENALFHLITVESWDIEIVGRASRLTPPEEQKQIEEDPLRQSALAAAFSSPKFDDYLGRLNELDRSVVSRYRFSDPYEVLLGEENGLPSYAFFDAQRFAKSVLESGQNLADRGEQKAALEKYWTVARFGQVLDSQGHTDFERLLGTSLQVAAYRQLQKLYEKQGNVAEAALFGYLAGKFQSFSEEQGRVAGQWAFGEYVANRNALFLQLSGHLLLVLLGLAVIAAAVLIAGSRRSAGPAAQRAKPLATVVALVSAVGVLLSTATLYLTYRPYWYIFQRAIQNGDRSGMRDLRHFLTTARMPMGFAYRHYSLLANFPFYFWTGVTAVGFIALALILLRHVHFRPRAGVSP